MRFKLLGAFLFVVCLLLGVGGLGLQVLDAGNERAENLAEFERKIAAYRQYQHDTTWQLYSVTEAVLSPDTRELDSVLRQLDQYRYDLDRVQFVSEDEKVLFEKTQAAHERLVGVVTDMVALSRKGGYTDTINAKLQEAAPIGEQLERLTNEMINRAEAGMVDLILSGQKSYHMSRSIFVGLALTAIGIAMILGYAISASIVGPVRQMDQQLGKTASGDFSHRINIPNRDEMGTLAVNLNRMNEELGRLYGALDSRNRFIRETFGRYLSDDIVEDILETPDGLKLGGENRPVAIMITDLRGFTALTERLGAEEVVSMLNVYFEIMVEVIEQFHGTIIEMIGDSLQVLFGAPNAMPDRISTAVACAIAMQNAMKEVNEKNVAAGLPELEMGIGLNDSAVTVGNIGSSRRLKYSVVGTGVNMASRIETYSVGGEILVSETMYGVLGDKLLVDGTQEVFAKGSETPIRIFSIAGIGEPYNLALDRPNAEPAPLARQVSLTYSFVDGKQVNNETFNAVMHRFSKREVVIQTDQILQKLVNLRLNLADVYAELGMKGFYAKVTKSLDKDRYLLRLTSSPPEVIAYLEAHRTISADGNPV